MLGVNILKNIKNYRLATSVIDVLAKSKLLKFKYYPILSVIKHSKTFDMEGKMLNRLISFREGD